MSNDYNGKKRSELPDSVFGIPQERKYPMPDEKHTRSAIKLFNHVDPKYEEQLAKAVIKNMKKYGIDGSVVGPNNRLRKYLPKDMIKESSIEEGFLKSDKDIYYNKDKFDSGEINLCFITGLSGSGKSTMGRNMSSKNIEHYEMDDVICNDNFSDDNLKEYGGLISSFFKGAGKSFRLIRDDDKHNDSVFNTHKNYEKEITQAFVKHAISYCKSHKGIKYVCDGIWIFMFIKPEQLKDCAVYIKGTSSIKSGYRALKRDIDEDKRNGMTSLQIFKHEFKRVKEDILYARENQKELKSFRSYFEKQSTNESVSSTVSKDHKQKGYISLSSLKKVHITESVINKYKKEYPVLRHVRCKDTNEYICDGYMWFKENDLVCYVGSCQYTDDHTKWIVSLEIIPKYRGYGLSNQILDYCVKSMKCKYLSVNKNNELAKKIYDKYGFKVYHEDKTMYYMTLDSIIKESSSRKITTVVFDLGDVLIKSNMQEKLRKNPKIPNQQVYPLLEKWFDDDLDLLSKEEYIDTISKRLAPDFSDIVPDIVDAFSDIEVLSYTIPTLKDLKERGYNIYYLSNWSRWGVEILRENNKLDFLSLFDGGLFSYEVGVKKPDRKIYDAFLKKFKINPKEAIFVDNKKKNIDAAEKFGIKGVLFSNEKDLQKYIKNMQSNINESSSILPQDTGISTVIFDIGDVLVSANIKDYLIADPEVPNEIVDELLKLWFIDKDEVDDTMDLGTYREIVNKRMGVEFSKYIPKLFKYNVECVTAFDYTIPMIQDLKDKGYKVYYLSNWSAWTYDLLQEAGKFDFLKLMDGGVFSYDAGYMKPNEEIYKILLNKYKINPEEAVFFDDREENIEAANKLGIHGVHFPRHDSSIVYNNLYGRKLSKAISEYTYLSYPFNPSYNEKAVGNIVARILEFELGTDPMSPDMGVSLQEFTKTGAQIGKAEIEDIRAIIDSLEDDSFDDFKFKDIVYCDIKYKAKKPIAFITIRVKNINNSTVGYVSLAVDPKYQNQGIGKSLTTKAVSWFKKEKGIDFLEWHCLQDNEASKKLASDAGFREYIAKNNDEYIRYTMESSIQEYGTTGGTIVGSNQPDSVYIVNYMQNNVFSGYKEPKRAICKKGMNQMYTTNSGKAIPVDIDKFKEEASNISVFRFKGTPVLSYDQIIENASTDNDFYLLLTGDSPETYGDLEYDNRFIQEENFFDELNDITFCTESTITGQIESSNYPYMKILTESMNGRSWNFYRDINGVFAMNELTGLRTPSYENAEEIPKSQIKLIERGTVYFGD